MKHENLNLENILVPQKVSAFFPQNFDFYTTGKVELLKQKTVLKDFLSCQFITSIQIIGEELGYFFVGAIDSKLISSDESMYQELANILAGKFVSLVSEQTTAYLTISPPQNIRCLASEKKLMLEFLKKSDPGKALVESYILRTKNKNIKIFAAFIPSLPKQKVES